MFAPDSFQGIGWLVVALASLCVTVNQVDDFFERRKTKLGFPPVEQLDSSQQALERRVDKLEDEIARLRREMKEDREAQSRSGSERAAGLYKKIDDVRAELSADIEAVRKELTENQRGLPNEIVTLLKNTNAI